MTYHDHFASLFISELDVEDAGKVKCKAVNEHGEIFTTARISVEGKSRSNNQRWRSLLKVEFYEMDNIMNCVYRSTEKEEKERKTTCRSIAQTQVSVLDALLGTCLLL